MKSEYNEKKDLNITELKRLDLLKELFPEEIISKKNLFQIMNNFYKNLEVKYKGISNYFAPNIEKTENSILLNTIFNLNKMKITDNIQKGFLNCLLLKGNAEQLYASLLKISEVQKALDQFIERNSESVTRSFSATVVLDINKEDTVSTFVIEKNNISL